MKTVLAFVGLTLLAIYAIPDEESVEKTVEVVRGNAKFIYRLDLQNRKHGLQEVYEGDALVHESLCEHGTSIWIKTYDTDGLLISEWREGDDFNLVQHRTD